MKAVFIVYNHAHTEKVQYLLDKLGIRGFTMWTNIYGRGSVSGVPHMDTHTWPEQNGAILSVVEDGLISQVLNYIKKIDEENREVGIRAFVWEITGGY